jgi:hypothetical protein
MNSDLTYVIVMHLMALAVILTCGAGIAWGYVSEARWGGERRAGSAGRPQKATGMLAQRQPAEREHTNLAA